MERPAASASRAEWDEYAESLGLDPENYSNKDELIEAVDEEEDSLVDTGDTATKAKPQERSPAWQKAYDHAIAIPGNTEKSATIFADQTFQSGDFGD